MSRLNIYELVELEIIFEGDQSNFKEFTQSGFTISLTLFKCAIEYVSCVSQVLQDHKVHLLNGRRFWIEKRSFSYIHKEMINKTMRQMAKFTVIF